jgi:arylsulfatase A-like enzyme
MKSFRVGAAVVSVAVSLGSFACSGVSKLPERPNIVLISLDTLRADRLGCYGYHRDTSPMIDRFAGHATLYASAHTTAPWTLPSHASLFTGLYPFEHGARTYGLDEDELHAADDDDAVFHHNARGLGQSANTLAERLALAGYQTAAVVANTIYLKRRYGVSQGFEVYDLKPGPGPEINERVFQWLEGRDSTRPFFLFINYMDVHAPYNAHPRPSLVEPALPYSAALGRRIGERSLMRDAEMDPADRQLLSDWYDLAVAALDDAVGLLLDRVKRDGIFDDALIIIISDHGEYLGEKDLSGHSKDVYEPTMAVPLIIKAPRQFEKQVDERLVSLVHVPALIAAHTSALDVEDLPRGWPEASLLGENHFSRLKDLLNPYAHRFNRSRIALYRDSHKYIHSTDGEHELYDLTRDPHEHLNLASTQPERLEPFTKLSKETLGAKLEIDSIGGGSLSEREKELTPDEVEQLKQLGYL